MIQQADLVADQRVEAAIDVRVLVGLVVAFGHAGENYANVRAEAKARRADVSIPVSPNGCSKSSPRRVRTSSTKACLTTARSAFSDRRQGSS